MPVNFPTSPGVGTTFTSTRTWVWNGSTWNAGTVPAGLVTTDETQTLINKTINGANNTITLAAGSIGTSSFADGSVTNAKLANSSITINGTAVSLGGSTTIDTGFSPFLLMGA